MGESMVSPSLKTNSADRVVRHAGFSTCGDGSGLGITTRSSAITTKFHPTDPMRL